MKRNVINITFQKVIFAAEAIIDDDTFLDYLKADSGWTMKLKNGETDVAVETINNYVSLVDNTKNVKFRRLSSKDLHYLIYSGEVNKTMSRKEYNDVMNSNLIKKNEKIGKLTKISREKEELKRGQWKSLADDTYYVKRSLKIGCGKLKLFIGYSPSENAIQDLYIVKSGQGGCEKNLQAIAIAISALLRIGGNLDQLKQAFSGITPCPSFIAARTKGIPLSTGNYCGMAIINEVEKFLKEIEGQEKIEVKQEKKVEKVEVKVEKAKCPECGERTLISTGGCDVCSSCGYSHCG